MLSCTIPMLCINRSLLEENVASLSPGCFLRITRMQNADSIDVFQNSDVFAKRSVIKGGDILRTLAVYETREQFDLQVVVGYPIKYLIFFCYPSNSKG